MNAALPADIVKKATALPLPDTDSWSVWMNSIRDCLHQFTSEDDKITFVAFNKDEDTSAMNAFVQQNGFDFLPVCETTKTHFVNATDVRAKLAQGILPENIPELHESTQKLITEFKLQDVFYQST